MATDDATRQHLLTMLQGNAGRRFEGAVKDFPIGSVNSYPPKVDYTPWHLVEHLRISLWDILDYIGNPNYRALKHPDDYWPAQDAQADAATWERSVDGYREGLEKLEEMVRDPQTDLLALIPHTQGHTVFREVGLVIGHFAYHIGEFGILRQVMQTWPPDHGTSARG
jgi:hypothetical protein